METNNQCEKTWFNSRYSTFFPFVYLDPNSPGSLPAPLQLPPSELSALFMTKVTITVSPTAALAPYFSPHPITWTPFPGCAQAALAQCYYPGQPLGNRLRRGLIDCLSVRAGWFSLSPASPLTLPQLSSRLFVSPFCLSHRLAGFPGCVCKKTQMLEITTEKRNTEKCSVPTVHYFSPCTKWQTHFKLTDTLGYLT